MDKIVWQYVNKQIKGRIQGLLFFDPNSHNFQLLWCLLREKIVYGVYDALVNPTLFTQDGNVNFNTSMILDWHWLLFLKENQTFHEIIQAWSFIGNTKRVVALFVDLIVVFLTINLLS